MQHIHEPTAEPGETRRGGKWQAPSAAVAAPCVFAVRPPCRLAPASLSTPHAAQHAATHITRTDVAKDAPGMANSAQNRWCIDTAHRFCKALMVRARGLSKACTKISISHELTPGCIDRIGSALTAVHP